MNDGLIGAIIGGIIGLASGVVTQFVKLNYDQKIKKYAKKEDVYLQALDIITEYRTEIPKSKNDKVLINPGFARKFNRMNSLMIIHSTDEIHDEFASLLADIVGSKMNSYVEGQDTLEDKVQFFSEMLIDDLEKQAFNSLLKRF